MSGQFQQPLSKPRKWWVAALLAILSAVVGYLYVGRPKRAVFAALLISLLVLLGFGFGGLMSNPTSGIIVYSTAFALQIVFIIDIIVIAVRNRSYVVQRYNRWWVYLGVLIGAIVAVETFRYAATTQHSIRLAHTFSITTVSMMPTILPGDYIIADARQVASDSPQRGDILFYLLPRDNSIRIARLIGLPGENVQILEGVLYINREPVPAVYSGEYYGTDQLGLPVKGNLYWETLPNGVSFNTLDIAVNSMGDNTNEFNVPEGHYFMLGDDRDNSSDSRFEIGYVPAENIAGVAAWIFWSSDLQRLGMRLR